MRHFGSSVFRHFGRKSSDVLRLVDWWRLGNAVVECHATERLEQNPIMRLIRILGWQLVALVPLVGCGPSAERSSGYSYDPNGLHSASLARDAQLDTDGALLVSREVAAYLEGMFGTIDAPRLPDLEMAAGVLDMQAVERCSGPVGRKEDKIERGIYRKHCVVCHGLSGDGKGQSAMFLEPYPRDFRRGTFKYKSTSVGGKPTRGDLVRTLREGIPGTAMPSYRALEESEEFSQDVEDLVDYVRFLSIRGEVERRMLTKILRDGEKLEEDAQWPKEILGTVLQKWREADGLELEVPEKPSWMHDGAEVQARELAVARGKELFESELTACSKCHGVEGLGDGKSQDYDEWTKDWTILTGIDPRERGAWKVMKPFGALKPVLVKSRNLQWGAFHGGGDADSIFRRIVLGIEGTPMPPVARAVNGNPGLTDEEIWSLVGYVMHLGRDRSSESVEGGE